MRKLCSIVSLCGLALIALTLTATPAFALFTPILPTTWAGEVDLITSGGILDQMYGLSNLTRIDDSFDQIWTMTGASGTATAQAKYANNSQELYWGPNAGSLNPILSLAAGGNGHFLGAPSATFSATGLFRFYDDPNGPGVDPPLWSSVPGENIAYSAESAGLDRMVTWRISGNSGYSGNVIGNYIMAWEDKDDNDYNDMVYEFSSVAPVPEPSSMLLLGMGLVGLAGRGIKKRFKA